MIIIQYHNFHSALDAQSHGIARQAWNDEDNNLFHYNPKVYYFPLIMMIYRRRL